MNRRRLVKSSVLAVLVGRPVGARPTWKGGREDRTLVDPRERMGSESTENRVNGGEERLGSSGMDGKT